MDAADRELLERHRPLLRYDSQAAYRALAAGAATDWPGNALRRGDGRALAIRGGAPALELATLSDYPGAEEPDAGDRLDFGEDQLAAAQAFQADPAYVDVAYGRVVRGGQRTWLQYWLFYYYNPHALLGFARHEGDWEMVQVGLGADGEPEWLTMAQHAFGQALAWDEAERHPGPDGPHPVVYVAPLSNASYPEGGTFPYLGGFDHPRGDGDEVLLQVEEFGPWVEWPGRWGNSRGVLGGRLGGASPEGPALQGRHRWSDPDAFHAQWRRPSLGRSLRALLAVLAAGPRPPAPVVDAALEGDSAVVRYRLPGGPIGRGRLLYVTVHDPATPESAIGRAGRRALLGQGTIEVRLRVRCDRALVRATCFSPRHMRSEVAEREVGRIG
jgi:hypothetical protein